MTDVVYSFECSEARPYTIETFVNWARETVAEQVGNVTVFHDFDEVGVCRWCGHNGDVEIVIGHKR